MPTATLGLLCGVWWVQQQAGLWSISIWVGYVLMLVVFVVVIGHVRVRQIRAKRMPSSVLGRSRQRFGRHLLVFILMCSLGLGWAQFRAGLRMQAALPLACQQQALRVQAVLVGVPERDARGQHVDAYIEHSLSSPCTLPSKVRLHLYAQHYKQTVVSLQNPPSIARLPVLHAGERWWLTVRLKRPHATRNPHGFDYAAWCLSHHIGAVGNIVSKAPMRRVNALVWQPSALIAHWREHVGAKISKVLGQTPQSAVLRALVIGDDSQIRRADWQLFVDSGINHLMSISGLHITMLAALACWGIAQLWRWRPQLGLVVPSKLAAMTGGACVAIAYAALAGFSIPTQRTLYMLLTVAALSHTRQRWPFAWVLSVALAVVLILDPWAVLAPGFWLSFGAVAVLAFALGGRLRSPMGWRAALQSQWVVSVAFVPVLWAMFNQVSLIAPLANAIAIPLVSLTVVPMAIAGALLPLDFLLQLASVLLVWGMQWLHFLTQWSWAVAFFPTPAPWASVLACLGVIVLLLPRGWPMRWSGVCLCLPLTLPTTPLLQSGQMRVTVLDVGQGLSVLVQTAHHQLLYDAGPGYNEESDAGQRIVLPYLRHLGVQKLDIAMISHDDSDHVGGMASVLRAIPAQQIRSSLKPQATFFQQMAPVTLPPHHPCVAGQRWQWDGVTFTVLAPPNDAAERKDNDNSCVLRIASAHGSLLLTGDIEKGAEYALLATATDLHSTVMTMPHHGSKTSSTSSFVAAVSPQWAIATNGYLNRFGHPKAEVLARYHALGSRTLRSDAQGAVLLDFLHGQKPQVRTWRQQEPHYWETPL